jgi:hypothetical protein
MELPKDCNYYEIVLMDDDKYDLGQSKFSKILAKMIQTEYKHFSRQYKEYIIDDKVIHNFNNEETKVSQIIPIDFFDKKTYRIIGYQKTKLTPLNYPSTTYIYNTSYIKKLIFRISNRIYINFEIALSDSKTYKIYINYNHDHNVDNTVITKSLTDILTLLLA